MALRGLPDSEGGKMTPKIEYLGRWILRYKRLWKWKEGMRYSYSTFDHEMQIPHRNVRRFDGFQATPYIHEQDIVVDLSDPGTVGAAMAVLEEAVGEIIWMEPQWDVETNERIGWELFTIIDDSMVRVATGSSREETLVRGFEWWSEWMEQNDD